MSTTAPAVAFGRNPAEERTKRALGRRRGLVDKIVTLFCLAATAVGLFFLGATLFTLLRRGLVALDLTIFTAEFAPTRYGDDSLPKGGLLHAITGSLIQVAIATAIGTPIDGTAIRLELLQPDTLDLAVYYDPDTLEPVADGGNQVILVSFADLADASGGAMAAPFAWDVAVTRNDGTTIAAKGQEIDRPQLAALYEAVEDSKLDRMVPDALHALRAHAAWVQQHVDEL